MSETETAAEVRHVEQNVDADNDQKMEETVDKVEHAGKAEVEEEEEEDMPVDINANQDPFYVRYYSGHQGRYGHEFLEFDVQIQDGGKCAILRYANNTSYRNEQLIKKQVTISPVVFREFKRIIDDCEILKEDDTNWPPKNRDGKQELEIRFDRFHISFETAKIGSMNDVQKADDPEGLRVFYFLVQDLKALVFSLVQCHFKIKPFKQ